MYHQGVVTAGCIGKICSTGAVDCLGAVGLRLGAVDGCIGCTIYDYIRMQLPDQPFHSLPVDDVAMSRIDCNDPRRTYVGVRNLEL